MIISRLLSLAAVVLLGIGLIGENAAAAGLLNPATSAASRARLPAAAVRHRLVQIDLGELSRHVVPPGSDTAPDRIERARRLDGVIFVELFADAAATFRRTDVEIIGDSGIAWSGTAAGSRSNAATLIVDAGEITGTVSLRGHYYRIDPLSNGLHRVTEIDRTALPHNENDFIVPNLPAPSPGDRRAPSKASSTIRVLVAYTKRALSDSPNIVNEIKLAVSNANKAYKNTQIKITLALAGTMKSGSYNEGADTADQWSQVLLDVSGFSGNVLSAVRSKRDELKADLVALIVRNSTIFCGLAWAPEFPGPGTDNQGFSEHSVDCLAAGIVFPHELGHNMGLFHDRKTHQAQGGGTPPKSKYNFGYINNGAGVIDIMSYSSSCTQPCAYIDWFSTSRFKYNGNVKLGIPQGKPGAADATRRLGETRDEVANYR